MSLSKIFLILILIPLVLYGCGEPYDDGTGSGELRDWGYVSNYRGATNKSRAYAIDTRKEIATVLIDAIDMGNRVFNNAYLPLNTPLLLDNVTSSGVNAPQFNLTEYGDCANANGTKVYNTNTFSWGQGYFRSAIQYNNFCKELGSVSARTVINGVSAFEDEEFDNSTSGSVRSVYSETTFDNVTVSINNPNSNLSSISYSLYGIMTRHSDRSSETANGSTLKIRTVDTLKDVHFGLDMPKSGTVYRFDFYYKVSGSPSRYIEFYHPNWGYVTVDLSSIQSDRIGELDPITMNFYDNETCIFTKYGLENDKSNVYPRWFDCKKITYEPKNSF